MNIRSIPGFRKLIGLTLVVAATAALFTGNLVDRALDDAKAKNVLKGLMASRNCADPEIQDWGWHKVRPDYFEVSGTAKCANGGEFYYAYYPDAELYGDEEASKGRGNDAFGKQSRDNDWGSHPADIIERADLVGVYFWGPGGYKGGNLLSKNIVRKYGS